MNDKYLYEIMRRYEGKRFIVRFWIKSEKLPDHSEYTYKHNDLINDFINLELTQYYDQSDISKLIMDKHSNELAAIEVVDKFGNGIVAYSSWL